MNNFTVGPVQSSVSVSIIIAVYNAEEYLERCLKSVIGQTLSNIEIVLVDDGSTDNSFNICNLYSNTDKRIKIIHKNNGGVASARQAGLEVVSGKYVIHVDPDDWIEPNMMEELFSRAESENADIVFSDFFLDTSKKSRYYSMKITSVNHKDVITALLEKKIFSSLCTCLIKLETIRKYSLRFIEGMDYREDTFFLCSLLIHPVKIGYMHQAYYHYDRFINEDSLSRKKKEIHFKCIKTIINELASVFEAQGYNYQLFLLKGMAKEKSIQEGMLKWWDFVRLYSEINVQYIYKYGFCKGYGMQKLVILGIIGFPGLAYKIWCKSKKTGLIKTIT